MHFNFVLIFKLLLKTLQEFALRRKIYFPDIDSATKSNNLYKTFYKIYSNILNFLHLG